MGVLLTLPYINIALTGANLTVSQSRRRKSPAAWDCRKMIFYNEYPRGRHRMKSLQVEKMVEKAVGISQINIINEARNWKTSRLNPYMSC